MNVITPRRLRRAFLFFVLLFLAIPSLQAQTPTAPSPAKEATNLLANGDFTRGDDAWEVPADAVASFVDGPNADFPKALRLQVRAGAEDQPWNISLIQPLASRLRKDQPLVFRAWLRSPTANKVNVFLEQRAAPYDKSLGGTLSLTPEWKEYEFKGVSKGDYAPEGTNLTVHLGFSAGTIDLAGLRLFDPTAPPDAGRSGATPEKPISLIANGDFSAPLQGTWNGSEGQPLQAEVVPADIAGYKKALRLTVSPPADANPWSVQVGQPVNATVSRDDAVYFRVWMRSPDRGTIGVLYEMATAPHTKMIFQTVKLTPEWKEYRFFSYNRLSFAPGESQAKFFLGYGKATIEIAGVRVENYGRAPRSAFRETIDYWGGVTPDDSWRAPALERIERIRKGDLKIRVIDTAGKPVPGATVTVTQKRHHFRWGTAGPVRRLLDTQNPDSARYRQEVARLFNTFTFESDLKWPNYAGNRTILNQVEQGIDWLHANGVENVRGHNLVWGSNRYTPEPIHVLSDDPLREALRLHSLGYAQRFRGKLYLWDVVNEAATNTETWERSGWKAFADTFRWAREGDPGALLAYNDYNIANEAPDAGKQRKVVFERIKYLLDNGAPVDVIGDQAHMHTPLTPIKRVLEIWDELAKFGKPIEITEFDAGIADDAFHGQYVRDFLIAAFSHPKIDAFIQWGFWEGQHWRAQDGGAMFRRDWSKRPAQEAYEDLVLNQWWTRAQLQTGADGRAATRAFYGLHEIAVEKDGKKTDLEWRLRPGTNDELIVEIVP